MFILSLPAFRWFKVDYVPMNPRYGHTCHPAGNNQIILIGGLASGNRSLNDDDPWYQGIGVFDMTALQWKTSYEANAAPYVAPDIVRKYYVKYVSFASYSQAASVIFVCYLCTDLHNLAIPSIHPPGPLHRSRRSFNLFLLLI